MAHTIKVFDSRGRLVREGTARDGEAEKKYFGLFSFTDFIKGVFVITTMAATGFAFMEVTKVKIENIKSDISTLIQNESEDRKAFWQAISDSKAKEDRDLSCLNSRVYRCCGEKADATC